MTYDPEKYREKREKVLGIKKRGIGFGTLALIVSFVIIAGLSAVTVPKAVSYITTRHLEDAIFKLESAAEWPDAVLDQVSTMDGVTTAIRDTNGARLVVTYDPRKVKISSITTLFTQQHLSVTLLNEVNHRQHQTTLKNEEENLETP